MSLQNYRRVVTLSQFRGEAATLEIERTADHWHARLFTGSSYDSAERRMTVTQPATDLNGGFEIMSDDEFFDRVRLVFGLQMSVLFDYVP